LVAGGLWQAAAVAADDPPGPPDDGVTVVVASRDRAEQLDRCLQALRAALGDDDELVVVDSASKDAAAVRQVAQRHGASLLRCDQPGVDRARNVGWRAGHRPFVMFTDDDATVDVGWARAMAASMSAHPEAAFTTGRLVARADEVDSSPQTGSTAPPSPAGAPSMLARIRAGRWSRDVAVKRETHPEVFDRRSVGNIGHGANLGVRREILERLGGWDEALGAGGRFRSAPEADLFDRCFALGLVGRYEPAAIAVHEQWRGPRRLLLLDARYGYGNGARIAKLLRTDRRRAALIARHSVWAWGIADLGRGIRWLDLSRILAALIRLGATGAGVLAALPVPVVDGHFKGRADVG
jgi:glycosyltransferase involved in cell wall biosynthesis